MSRGPAANDTNPSDPGAGLLLRDDPMDGPPPLTASPLHAPVAVIVPVVNEATCLDALERRLGPLNLCEIIVVDGGSSDGTAEALESPCPRRFPGLCAQKLAGQYRLVRGRRGRAVQMNAGAFGTEAQVLVFLHADTTFSQRHLAAVLRAVAEGADFGCFRLRLRSADPRLRLVGRLITLRSRLLPSATGDQAIFMRRDLFESLGGYRDMALCEDLDLIRRASRAGRYVCLGEEVETSARRWEERGVYRTIALMWALRLMCHAGVDPLLLKQLYEDVR